MYQIVENGKVIHESHHETATYRWAAILRDTQGRTVSIQFNPNR